MAVLVSSFRIKDRSIELVHSSLESDSGYYWLLISMKKGLSLSNYFTRVTLFYPKYHAYRIYARIVGYLIANYYTQ